MNKAYLPYEQWIEQVKSFLQDNRVDWEYLLDTALEQRYPFAKDWYGGILPEQTGQYVIFAYAEFYQESVAV